MVVTLTSKGQLTLPKAIRDELKLDAGSKLDFKLRPDGSLTIRVLNRSAQSLFGMLRRPGMKAASLDEMHRARDAYLAEDDQRIVNQANKRSRARKKAA